MVAITAAMLHPTGLAAFAEAYPDRRFDVGIAEQHAVTSAAGLAMGGLHPVVAVYATFLNRAFDQVLMDVALHRLPVTFVLDRAGLTGDDGPSHNGMWDLSILGVVPGVRIAAPRDGATLREELREAVAYEQGPTVVRFPKTPLGPDLPAARAGTAGWTCCARPRRRTCCWSRSARPPRPPWRSPTGWPPRASCATVVDPRWVTPVDPALLALAARHRLVVTVEDGVVAGGVGSRLSQALRSAGIDVPTRDLGVPARFLEQGKVAAIRAEIGLTAQDVARQLVGWAAGLDRTQPAWTGPGQVTPSAPSDAGRRAGVVVTRRRGRGHGT